MTRSPLRILTVGLAGLALIAASCGDDEESSDNTEAEADDSDNTEADSDDTEATDDAEPDDTEADEPDDTEADEPADTGDGGCQVTVTGEIEKSWTSSSDQGSVLYGPWIPGVAASVLDMNLDASDLIINCTTEEEGISFTGNGTAEIPMQPATYVISGEQGALGGGSAEIGAIINLGGDDLYGMAADGNLTFTEFDEDHISGTFELPVKQVFGTEESAEPTATVTGSFSFENLND